MTPIQDFDGATDEELMTRVRDREDTQAFGCLYDRHASRAYRVARSICGDPQRSEEAVQEGFLSMWRGRDRFRADLGSFQAWSSTVVRCAAIDTVRRERAQKRPRLSDAELDAPDHAGSPEDVALARNEAETLRKALSHLPVAQAEVIALAFYGELTHSEIAVQLKLPSGTVKGRMRLGLQKLRCQLDRAEFVSAPVHDAPDAKPAAPSPRRTRGASAGAGAGRRARPSGR